MLTGLIVLFALLFVVVGVPVIAFAVACKHETGYYVFPYIHAER